MILGCRTRLAACPPATTSRCGRGARPPLSVTLHDATGRSLARPLSLATRDDARTGYTGTPPGHDRFRCRALTVATTGAVTLDHGVAVPPRHLPRPAQQAAARPGA